ncbi:MAG: hypothetical protein HYY84_02030 [Deltaproteobacteria bacterium]|nr:hypothetical protein [Deltaproteobacteria bacterium]
MAVGEARKTVLVAVIVGFVVAACRGGEGGPAADSDAGGDAGALTRIAFAHVTPRLDAMTLARIATDCAVYCQARGADGGCDAGATIGAGLNATIARPEIVLSLTESDGGAVVDRGLVVYVLHEVSGLGQPPVWSPACQQRQQRFAFDRTGGSLILGGGQAMFDDVFDFLPELPDATTRDFCSTRDTRLSEAVDGGIFATTQVTIGAVSDAGLCTTDGGQEDWIIFADFKLQAGSDGVAANVNDDLRDVDGPGSDPAYCGALQRSPDDIPTAIIAGDQYAATSCSNLLDTAGVFPRFYAVVRKTPDGGASRIYRVPIYVDGGTEVPAVWFRTGGKQGALVDARTPGRAEGVFVYAATSPDAADVSRLAWFRYDFDADGGAGDFVRDAGVAVAGYIPRLSGLSHVVEKYALGLAPDGAGNFVIAYLTEDAAEYCDVVATSQTTCFKDDTGHLRLRVVSTDFRVARADVSISRGDAVSDVDPERLKMAPTHPDLIVKDGRVFMVYAFSHYPALGCGADGGMPCRGKSDIVTQTSVVDVWGLP